MSIADNSRTDKTAATTVNLPWLGTWPLDKIFFAVILVVFCLNLLPRTFWAENEAYYALGAGNVLDGHFLVPVIYDNTLADKPPLMFWYIALVSLPFGSVTEFTARLANLIPAFLILFAVYRFTSHISQRAATLAIVVLATAHEYYEVVFEVNTDVLLTAFLLVSWIALYKILETGFTWKLWILLWVPMGLGMLTKGPVALVLSGLIAFAYAFPRYGWRDGWRRLLLLRPFTGAALCFLPFLLWCAIVYNQYGRDPLDVILLRHNVERFVDAFDHQKPWYYYFYTLPIVMLPWSLLFPLVATQLWREKLAKLQLPAWKSFALTVVVVGFVLFSWSSSKRAYYMLPIMPWIAILLGDVMSRIGNDRPPRQELRARQLITASAAAMLVMLLLYITIGYRLLDNNRSISDLAATVNRTTGQAEKLILFEDEDPRLMFYLPEDMTFYSDAPEHREPLIRVLNNSGSVDLLTQRRGLKTLVKLSPVPLHLQASADYRDNRFYILTTTPDDSLPMLSAELIQHLKDEEKKHSS